MRRALLAGLLVLGLAVGASVHPHPLAVLGATLVGVLAVALRWR